ncbi:Rib/alpha-like domain-containing protein, partial [Limosilactobacillus agrestis]
PGTEIPTTVPFNATDNPDITVQVQAKKDTDDGRNDKGNKDVYREVTRTITVNIEGQAPQTVTQTLAFYRIKTTNEATGKVTYTDWTSDMTDGATSFPELEIPSAAGYTRTITGGTITTKDGKDYVASVSGLSDGTPVNNITVTVDYKKADQTRKIVFVDGGKTVGTQTLTGKTGTSVTIGNGNGETPLQVPTGYEVVPGTEIPTTVPFNATDNPDITVKVQAKTDTDDGRNDKGNKDVYREVTRTITVNIEGQAPQTVTQKLDFYRIKTTNEATGKISYTDWTSNMTDGTTSFPELEIPSAAGYTRTITGGTITTKDGKDYVAAQSGLENGEPVNNITVTVNYTYSDQTATIKYVNNADHNDVVGTQVVPGKTGETVPVTLQVPANWKVVGGQNIPSEFTFGSAPIKDTIVYVEHGTKDVTNDPSQADKVNKTITRTIKTNVEGKVTTLSPAQTVTLHRSATEDLVTGEITYGDWNTAKFAAVTAPNIPGYTVTNPDAAPAMDVTGKTEDSTVTFNYTADGQTRKIIFVDNGNTVGTQTLTGKTGTSVTIGNGNGETPLQVPTGYEVVPGTEIPTTVPFNATDNPDITVKVQAKTDTDDGRNDKGNKDVYREVTRTITVNIEGQAPQTRTQTLAFYRIKTTNEATGKVTYTDWTSNMEDGATSFPELEIPSEAGYTRTITGGTITTKDGKDYVAAQSGLENGEPVNNITVTVNYTYSDQTATIKYVNNADHNDVVGTQVVPGKTGETVPVTLQVPANWKVVGGQNIPSSFTFGNAPIKDTIVYVEHGTKDVTNDPSQADKVNKTITRTIDLDIAGKTSEYTKQTATIHRTATEDLVTGDVTYSAWNVDGAKFKAVTAPEEAGYTVTNPDAAPAMDVTGNTEDSTVTFNYTANEHSVTITYVDKSGKKVGGYTENGVTGETVDPEINAHVPNGYHVVGKYPTSITFGSSDPAPITVHVEENVNPTDADNYTPKGQDVHTNVGKTPNASEGIANKGDLPTGTSYTWKTTPDVTTPGTKDATVVVTYPDGSQDEVPVHVIVTDNTPTYSETATGTPIVTEQGVEPNPEDGIGNKDELDPNTKYTWTNGEPDVSKIGKTTVSITVTYPDGKTQIVDTPLIVTGTEIPTNPNDPSQSDLFKTVTRNINTTTPDGKTTTQTQKVTFARTKTVDKNGDTSYSAYTVYNTETNKLTDDTETTLPVVHVEQIDGYFSEVNGVKATEVSAISVNASSKPEDVNVTYAESDAHKYTPEGQPINTDKGVMPNPGDGIKNKGDLPTGTTYTWTNGEPDVSTPGTKPVTITVHYPDGTTDTVTTTITVTDDADKYTPKPNPINTDKGHMPDPSEGIGNKGDLPTGTTYTWTNGEPDVNTPGTKPVTITVHYPDGTTDTVTTTITVTDDADKYTPEPNPINTDKGHMPDP